MVKHEERPQMENEREDKVRNQGYYLSGVSCSKFIASSWPTVTGIVSP